MEQTVQTGESTQVLFRLERLIRDSSDFMRRHGIHRSNTIAPSNRAIFLSWPIEKLQMVTDRVQKTLDVHLNAENDPCFDFDDSSSLLKVALRELSLKIDPEFYKMINRSDILEVYDKDHIQVFRSFNFFQICSYNLDDILCHEWFDLYERESLFTDQIMTAIDTHLNGNLTFSPANIEEHLMRERFSEGRAAFVTKFKYFASVFSGPNQKPGFVCTIAAKQLGAINIDFIRSKNTQFKQA